MRRGPEDDKGRE
jgi:protein-S-isoprenylcysteine O-methyltransferase Ste14